MTLLTRLVLCVVAIIASGNAQVQEAIKKEEGKSVALKTHSLYPPYIDADLQSRWWEFGGDTVVDANNQVRLTYDRPSQAGWIFSRLPLTATNFEIIFEFKIHGKGTGVYGDGMAMWITKQRAQTGTVFGFSDKFEGLGVFIDTYKNGRTGTTFPYVMAMLGDGKTPYDVAMDGKANEVGGCSARGIRKASIPTMGKLTYHKDNFLSLELQYQKEGEWIQCFNIPNVTLPTVTYLGFSAHTGEVTDFHDILKVETKTIYAGRTATLSSNMKNQHQNDGAGEGGKKSRGRSQKPIRKVRKSDSWVWAFARVLAVLVIMLVGYFAWTAYRVHHGQEPMYGRRHHY